MAIHISRRILCISIPVLVIIGIWWIMRPQGKLQLDITENLNSQASTIRTEMEYAVALMPDFSESAARLNYLLHKDRVHYILPGTNRETSISFGDVLELEFEYELKKGHTTFRGKFHPDPLLNFMYGTFGYYDYHIAVRDFAQINSQTNERKFKALLRLYPIESHGRAIPRTGTVSETVFRYKIAKYLLDSLETDSKQLNCKQYLCREELPENLQSLEVTVNAFKFLYEKRNSSICDIQESDELCVERIEEQFSDALKLEPGNGFAQLGLGLAQLRHVGLSIPEVSAAAVGHLLMEAIANISSAKQNSEYIANLMSSTEWTKMVRRTPGLSEFPVTTKFIDTADGYRQARRAFAEADYGDVPKALAKIDELPPLLRPHVRNLELSARLLSATTPQEAEPLLMEFKELPHSNTDGTWFATYGLYLCLWSQNVPGRIEEAIKLMDNAIQLSGTNLVAYLDRRAQKGMCLALVNRDNEARMLLDDVATDLLDQQEHQGEGFQRIYYDLGIGFALMGEFESASGYLSQAVSISTAYLLGISKLNLLESFRQWSGYQQWRTMELQHIKREGKS